MTETRRNVGSRIREARKKAELTQEVLAELAGITTSYAGQVERGEKNASTPVLTRIAKALEVPLSGLLDGQELRESKTAYEVRPKWKQLIKLSENVDDEILDVFLKILRLFRVHKKVLSSRKKEHNH